MANPYSKQNATIMHRDINGEKVYTERPHIIIGDFTLCLNEGKLNEQISPSIAIFHRWVYQTTVPVHQIHELMWAMHEDWFETGYSRLGKQHPENPSGIQAMLEAEYLAYRHQMHGIRGLDRAHIYKQVLDRYEMMTGIIQRVGLVTTIAAIPNEYDYIER